MKRTFVWLTATSLSIAPLIHAQDPDKETDEQLKEAAEAAKKMDVQMPDIKKLLEEDEKETSKEKEQNAAKNADGKKTPRMGRNRVHPRRARQPPRCSRASIF